MKQIRDEKEILLLGKKPMGCDTFCFSCHSGVECFTNCCKNVNIDLYPYDIIRMKNNLAIRSEEFIEQHTFTVIKDNPNFPNVKLRLREDEERRCPFLTDQGCQIYPDRPDACRIYPLERAVSIVPLRPYMKREFYFLTPQPVCKGHFEQQEWTVKSWLQNQEVSVYNAMNDMWAEIDVFFRTLSPGELDLRDPKMTMAFMASYNIDSFRDFIFGSTFMKRYKIKDDMIESIRANDVELMKFGFDWIKFYLFKIKPIYFKLL